MQLPTKNRLDNAQPANRSYIPDYTNNGEDTPIAELIREYHALGWNLCSIEPGSKGPRVEGWGDNPLKPNAPCPAGVGLIHLHSRTCAVDIDNLESATAWLSNHGIDLQSLLNDDDAVHIVSGKANRAKLLYRLPDDAPPPRQFKLKIDKADVLDLRCQGKNEGKYLQDVLPPTIHPDTGQPYRWGGNGDWRNLPVIPADLLRLWTSQPKQESSDPKASQPTTSTGVPEGGRNDYLYRLGGDMARHQGMAVHVIDAALQAINQELCSPPLGMDEVTSIARSAASYSDGARHAASYSPAHHPLLQFEELDLTAPVPSWVIPGVIAAGIVTIAGGRGVGKTTNIVPLAVIVAGLHEDGNPLAPRHWRHVVYISEDTAQLRRVLAGLVEHGGKGINADTLRERFHVVPAKRLPAETVALAGGPYRSQFTRDVGGVAIPPLVVIDTAAATLDMEDDNSNTEWSRAIACLKQDFADLPTWIVGHVAKADLNRAEAATLTMRGAGSIENDANQTMYMVNDHGTRYLVCGKTRFEPKWHQLQFDGATADVQVQNEFGEHETVTLRWGWPEPVTTRDRAAAAEQAKVQAQKAADSELRQSILDAVATAWAVGNPINRTAARDAAGGNSRVAGDVVGKLIAEGWLCEVEVPQKQRTNNRRSHYLICLDAAEHDAWASTGELPADKLVIPPTWRKVIPFVPADQAVDGENTDGTVADAA